MDASTEMIIVQRKALFLAQHTLFKILHFLVAHAEIKERICLWWILLVFTNLHPDSLIYIRDSLIVVFLLVEKFSF